MCAFSLAQPMIARFCVRFANATRIDRLVSKIMCDLLSGNRAARRSFVLLCWWTLYFRLSHTIVNLDEEDSGEADGRPTRQGLDHDEPSIFLERPCEEDPVSQSPSLKPIIRSTNEDVDDTVAVAAPAARPEINSERPESDLQHPSNFDFVPNGEQIRRAVRRRTVEQRPLVPEVEVEESSAFIEKSSRGGGGEAERSGTADVQIRPSVRIGEHDDKLPGKTRPDEADKSSRQQKFVQQKNTQDSTTDIDSITNKVLEMAQRGSGEGMPSEAPAASSSAELPPLNTADAFDSNMDETPTSSSSAGPDSLKNSPNSQSPEHPANSDSFSSEAATSRTTKSSGTSSDDFFTDSSSTNAPDKYGPPPSAVTTAVEQSSSPEDEDEKWRHFEEVTKFLMHDEETDQERKKRLKDLQASVDDYAKKLHARHAHEDAAKKRKQSSSSSSSSSAIQKGKEQRHAVPSSSARHGASNSRKNPSSTIQLKGEFQPKVTAKDLKNDWAGVKDGMNKWQDTLKSVSADDAKVYNAAKNVVENLQEAKSHVADLLLYEQAPDKDEDVTKVGAEDDGSS
ncbi:unnamed protein product [Amoebophrya sp. A120]|nr:unnamed protein product [Amoebophrya sp. A120]|eukprot:GSA120T00004951001.1